MEQLTSFKQSIFQILWHKNLLAIITAPLSLEKAFDVFFKNVSVEAYERPSFGYQVTNEIVQALVQTGLIERDTLEYIKLTAKGLDKCKEDCR